MKILPTMTTGALIMAAITAAAAALTAAGATSAATHPGHGPHAATQPHMTISNGRLGATIIGGTDSVTIHIAESTLAAATRRADGSLPADSADPAGRAATLTITDLNAGRAFAYRWRGGPADSICRDGYGRGDLRTEREYFASRTDSLIAIRLRASGHGTLCCAVSLSSPLAARVKASPGGQLTMTGSAGGSGAGAVRFCLMARADAPAGAASAEGRSIRLCGCAEATIYIVCRTSADPALPGGADNAAPYLERTADDAWHTVNHSYQDFRERHLAGRRATECDEERHNPAPTAGPQPTGR